jgi:3-dehydroquinate synthetase
MPAIPVSLERSFLRRLTRRLPPREYGHLLSEPLHKKLTESEEEEKTASRLADRVLLRCKLASLSQDELSELAHDLQQQTAVHGVDAASRVLPHKHLRNLLQEVQKESHKQTLMGFGGGAIGGVAGGASGAALAALIRGRSHALTGGLLGILPGSIGGYVLGKRLQQHRELSDRLREKL